MADRQHPASLTQDANTMERGNFSLDTNGLGGPNIPQANHQHLEGEHMNNPRHAHIRRHVQGTANPIVYPATQQQNKGRNAGDTTTRPRLFWHTPPLTILGKEVNRNANMAGGSAKIGKAHTFHPPLGCLGNNFDTTLKTSGDRVDSPLEGGSRDKIDTLL